MWYCQHCHVLRAQTNTRCSSCVEIKLCYILDVFGANSNEAALSELNMNTQPEYLNFYRKLTGFYLVAFHTC